MQGFIHGSGMREKQFWNNDSFNISGKKEQKQACFTALLEIVQNGRDRLLDVPQHLFNSVRLSIFKLSVQ